jgi:tRNA A-37 threonylcarbamoyl transferase component Bud32
MPDLITTFGNLQRSRPASEKRRPPRAAAAADVPTDVVSALRQMQLLASGDSPRVAMLPSSLATRASRIDLGWGTIFLKRALAPEAAPEGFIAERVGAEAAWFKVACGVVPGVAPTVLGSLPAAGVVALEYLPPEEFPSWQSRLAAGKIEPWVAAELGHLVGRLHAASANSLSVAERFASREAFRTLALSPLLARAAAAAPDCAPRIAAIGDRLGTIRCALVHGTLAPDNVLVGPRGPVLIDADCAHSGDPMFDVASVLAALALRMVTHRQSRIALVNAFDAFHRSYFAHVTWEMPEEAEARATMLLPVLLAAGLGSMRGVGPAQDWRSAIDAARALLTATPTRLEELLRTWLDALSPA